MRVFTIGLAVALAGCATGSVKSSYHVLHGKKAGKPIPETVPVTIHTAGEAPDFGAPVKHVSELPKRHEKVALIIPGSEFRVSLGGSVESRKDWKDLGEDARRLARSLGCNRLLLKSWGEHNGIPAASFYGIKAD